MESVEQQRRAADLRQHQDPSRSWPHRQSRVPTAAALEAKQAFRELQAYFAESTALRRALGWSAPTLRLWLEVDGPVRPRAQSVVRVTELCRLARAAAEWVADPRSVGDWLVASHPGLDGASPALVARTLGHEGVSGLIARIDAIAPQERVSIEPVELTADVLRETLRTLGVTELQRAPSALDVDLSDFDD